MQVRFSSVVEIPIKHSSLYNHNKYIKNKSKNQLVFIICTKEHLCLAIQAWDFNGETVFIRHYLTAEMKQ